MNLATKLTRFTTGTVITLVVGFSGSVKAQDLGRPGAVVPGETTSLMIASSEMTVLNAAGVYQEVTAAVVTRSMNFKQNKDLLTVSLVKDGNVVEKIEFVVREIGRNECGSAEIKATPLKRLPNNFELTVTDPSAGCRTEKTRAVLYRSFGMTGMLEGSLEMEGSTASPF